MKNLGKRSLSAVMAIAVNLLWWAEWIAGALGVFMVLTAAHIRKAFALQVPITYTPMSMAQIYSAKQKGDFSILNTTNGTLSIHVGADWKTIVALLTGYGAIFAVIVIITYQVKRIFESFKQDQPFQQANIYRVRNIALVLIGYSVVQWSSVIVINQFLLSNFIFHHLDLTYDFNYTCLLIGVVLLAVEGVFKTGLALEEEKQLTI